MTKQERLAITQACRLLTVQEQLLRSEDYDATVAHFIEAADTIRHALNLLAPIVTKGA